MAILQTATGKRSRKWSRQALVLYYGLTDPATPFYAKIPALFSLAYLLSPIDLIPDFIPLAGWLDEFFIVPPLLAFSIRLFPKQIKIDSEARAAGSTRKLRIILVLAVIAILLLLTALFLLGQKLLAHS